VQPKHLALIAILIFTTVLGGATLPPASTPTHKAAYVEPPLWSSEAETLSLIVTAGDSQTAMDIVEQLGGRVTSDLGPGRNAGHRLGGQQ
jgi:hypothetical protein